MPKHRQKLDIKCGESCCEENEHSFIPIKPRNKPRPLPTGCTKCGVAPVNWKLLRQRNFDHVEALVSSLGMEHIRAYFWSRDLSDLSKKLPLMQGRSWMISRVEKRLKDSIGSAYRFRDGTQTPLYEDGDPIHYAQHATATCCRKCVFCWHGIPEGRALTADELNYLGLVVWRFLDEKLPELTKDSL